MFRSVPVRLSSVCTHLRAPALAMVLLALTEGFPLASASRGTTARLVNLKSFRAPRGVEALAVSPDLRLYAWVEERPRPGDRAVVSTVWVGRALGRRGAYRVLTHQGACALVWAPSSGMLAVLAGTVTYLARTSKQGWSRPVVHRIDMNCTEASFSRNGLYLFGVVLGDDEISREVSVCDVLKERVRRSAIPAVARRAQEACPVAYGEASAVLPRAGCIVGPDARLRRGVPVLTGAMYDYVTGPIRGNWLLICEQPTQAVGKGSIIEPERTELWLDRYQDHQRVCVPWPAGRRIASMRSIGRSTVLIRDANDNYVVCSLRFG